MPKHFKVAGEVTGFAVTSAPATIGGFRFEGTRIHNNRTPNLKSARHRVCIQDVQIRRCQHWANYANAVIFRNIDIEDVRGGGRAPLFLRACFFENVRIRGWFGGVCFQWQYSNDETLNRALLDDNLRRYQSVEIALDIAEGRWTTYDSLIGVPAKLVKRDPARQFILTRKSAAALADRRDIRAFSITAEDLLKSGLPDTVIVPGEKAEYMAIARQLLGEKLLS